MLGYHWQMDQQRTVHGFISTCNYMAANELGPSYQAQDRYNLTYPLGYSNYIKSNHMRCKHGKVTNGCPLGDIYRPSIFKEVDVRVVLPNFGVILPNFGVRYWYVISRDSDNFFEAWVFNVTTDCITHCKCLHDKRQR